jgi:CRISPR-associated protein Cas1
VRIEIVDEFGSGVQKHSERLILVRPGENGQREKRNAPLLLLDHLVIGARGVSLSSDAIQLCCERGVPITVIDFRGQPIARLVSPSLHGTAAVRRAQLSAYNTSKGAIFSRRIVEGKLRNQAANLRYFAKNRRTRAPQAFELMSVAADRIICLAKEAGRVKGKSCDEVRQALMKLEADAAREYWPAMAQVVGKSLQFRSREQRGTRNPVNAALNFAYGVLTSEVWNATLLAGLEPYAGFLHVDRPGRLSFVLDLIEEFRPAFADRVVFALAAKGWKIELDERGWLTRPCKLKLIEALSGRFETPEPHAGKHVRLRSIIQLQARDSARHFLGKAEYAPYRMRW